MVLSSTRAKVTINTLSQFIGRISSSATTFILTVILARSLGSQGYGDFSKITTYVSFFYLFADFGMNAAFLQLKTEDKRFTFRHLMSARLLVSTVLVFVAISFLSLLPQGNQQGYTSIVRLGIILYSLSIIAQGLITTLNAIFQEKLRYEFAMLAVLGGSVFRLIITFLFGTGSVIGAILCFLLGAIATVAIALPFARRLEMTLSPLFSFKHFIKLFNASLPLGITLVFNLIYFRVDSIILTLTQSTQDVGVYNLAYSFFEFALVIPLFFLNALYPLLLKRKQESQESFYQLSKKAGLVLFGSSFVAALGVWLSAPLISLINPEFSPGIQVLRILSFSLPFFFLTSLTMWIFITMKKWLALVTIYGLSMVLNIVANVIFLPRIGLLAAAWITFFGEGFVLLLSGVVILSEARQTLNLRRILRP